MKIAVAGTGYVGLSLAVLLAQHNEVTAVDVIPEKVEKINQRISPIQDEYIEKYLAEKDLNLVATLDGAKAYKEAELVVIAAPTNYDPKKNFFDTRYVEQVIELVLSVNKYHLQPRIFARIQGFIRQSLSESDYRRLPERKRKSRSDGT